MPQANRLESFLQDRGAHFEVDEHRETFTAQSTAQVEHVPGKHFVKVVMVKADGDLVMMCVPAPHAVDLDEAAEVLDADSVSLASEEEFRDVFADCDVGAMPPFGNLYDVPVWVDQALTEDDWIVFNACSHTRAIRMAFDEFERLVQPRVARFSRREH